LHPAFADDCIVPKHLTSPDTDPQTVFGLTTANGSYIGGYDAAAIQAYDKWFDHALSAGESGDEDTILGFVFYADLLESQNKLEPARCLRSIAYGSVLQNWIASPSEISWAAQAIAANSSQRATIQLRTAAEKLIAQLAEIPGNTSTTLIGPKSDAYGAYLLVLLGLDQLDLARAVNARYEAEVAPFRGNAMDSGLIVIAQSMLQEKLGNIKAAENVFLTRIPPSSSITGTNRFDNMMSHLEGDFPAVRRQVALIRAAVSFYQRHHLCRELSAFVSRYAASWQVGPYLGEPARLYAASAQCVQVAQGDASSLTAISKLRAQIRAEIAVRATAGQFFQLQYTNTHFLQAADTILATSARTGAIDEDAVMDGFQFARFGPAGWCFAYLARMYAEPDPAVRHRMEDYLKAEAIFVRFESLGASAAIYGADDAARKRATDAEYFRLTMEWGKYGGATPAPAHIGDVHASSGILSPAEIREHLRPSDAVLTVAVLDSGVYAAIVKRNGFTFRRVSISPAEIDTLVSRLRTSLDPESTALRPDFDFAAALRLGESFFSPFAHELEGVTRIFWVPDGALTKLPPTIFISSTFTAANLADYRKAPWLIRRFAFVTLPSITAIGLGSPARPVNTASFLGIGDPVLGTIADNDLGVEWRGLRNINDMDRLPRLPETADELRQEAALIGGRTRVLLGTDATEPIVRDALSSPYQVVAFATHGLSAGDLQGLQEPALVVTPGPVEQRTSDNFGLLTESKIELMRIPADWVILSACNTAAPGLFGQQEPLSGLSRAFFIAGTRSLLISNWRVDSQTAVRLTTETVAKWRSGVDQAAALQWAIEKVIDDPDNPELAHPRMWAPFSLVGVTGR
jgi:CHAT domain-containing protein